MEVIFIGVIMGGVLIASLATTRAADMDLLAAWTALAEASEMTAIEATNAWFAPPTLSGKHGSREVVFSRYTANKQTGTRLTIDGCAFIGLRREGLSSRIEKFAGTREIVIGDPAFDRAVFIEGPEGVLRAILGHETRQRVLDLTRGALDDDGAKPLRGGGLVENGRIVLEILGAASVATARLTAALPALFDLADRLVQPENIPACLARNASQDPLPSVRLQNLRLLTSAHPTRPATRAALERACTDVAPEMRLHAASALAPSADATLLQLASQELADAAIERQAIVALGNRVEATQAAPILSSTIRRGRTEAACALLAALGRRGGLDSAALLAQTLREQNGVVAAAAARALAACPTASTETELLAALGREDDVVAEAVAEALDRVGTIAAVLPLSERADRSSARAVRRAARHAIVAIQSRLTGATPGQLSVSDGSAGAVSVAEDDPAGRVSVTDDLHAEPRALDD